MNDLRLQSTHTSAASRSLARLFLSLHRGSSIAPLDPMGTSPPDEKNFVLGSKRNDQEREKKGTEKTEG